MTNLNKFALFKWNLDGNRACKSFVYEIPIDTIVRIGFQCILGPTSTLLGPNSLVHCSYFALSSHRLITPHHNAVTCPVQICLRWFWTTTLVEDDIKHQSDAWAHPSCFVKPFSKTVVDISTCWRLHSNSWVCTNAPFSLRITFVGDVATHFCWAMKPFIIWIDDSSYYTKTLVVPLQPTCCRSRGLPELGISNAFCDK